MALNSFLFLTSQKMKNNNNWLRESGKHPKTFPAVVLRIEVSATLWYNQPPKDLTLRPWTALINTGLVSNLSYSTLYCVCSPWSYLAFHPCLSAISCAASKNGLVISLEYFFFSSLHVTLWSSAVYRPSQRAWSISATREHYPSLMAAKRPSSGG